jgi:hypothetical protein
MMLNRAPIFRCFREHMTMSVMLGRPPREAGICLGARWDSCR